MMRIRRVALRPIDPELRFVIGSFIISDGKWTSYLSLCCVEDIELPDPSISDMAKPVKRATVRRDFAMLSSCFCISGSNSFHRFTPRFSSRRCQPGSVGSGGSRPSSTATSWMSAAERSMPRRGAAPGSGGAVVAAARRRSDDGNRVYVAFAESCGSFGVMRRPPRLVLVN